MYAYLHFRNANGCHSDVSNVVRFENTEEGEGDYRRLVKPPVIRSVEVEAVTDRTSQLVVNFDPYEPFWDDCPHEHSRRPTPPNTYSPLQVYVDRDGEYAYELNATLRTRAVAGDDIFLKGGSHTLANQRRGYAVTNPDWNTALMGTMYAYIQYTGYYCHSDVSNVVEVQVGEVVSVLPAAGLALMVALLAVASALRLTGGRPRSPVPTPVPYGDG